MLVPPEICDQYSDQEIIKKALEEVDFFACIYYRYESRLLNYIIHLSSFTKPEAEDILQEAFIKVWKNLHGFDPSLKFKSWLYRIVHNCTISHWRKMKNADLLVPIDKLEYRPDSVVNDYEEEVEPRTVLDQFLRRIPQKYKEVLVLKYFESMSYEEISDVLKIPEGTVAVRLNRAKKALIKLKNEYKYHK